MDRLWIGGAWFVLACVAGPVVGRIIHGCPHAHCSFNGAVWECDDCGEVWL